MGKLVSCRDVLPFLQSVEQERLTRNALLEFETTDFLLFADVATEVTNHLLDSSLTNQKLSSPDFH